MKNRRGKSFKAITWMLTLSMVLLWTACMGCMTYMRAEQIVSEGGTSVIWNSVGSGKLNGSVSIDDFEYDMLFNLCNSVVGPFTTDDPVPSQGAMMVVDSKGEVRWQSQDLLMFEFVWISGDVVTEEKWAWIDLEGYEELSNVLKKNAVWPIPYGFAYTEDLRITGYLEENKMITKEGNRIFVNKEQYDKLVKQLANIVEL